ncbi:MAG: metalloregulator ArsR/SmtB family transcription factor [Sulfolobaceae archaeon]
MEPLITELEAFFNAIADKTRLQIILFLLENGEVTVNQISESLKKSQSLISHHLACLRNCGVVKMERRGKFVYYSITSDEVRQIIKLGIKHVKEYGKSILACEVLREENGKMEKTFE